MDQFFDGTHCIMVRNDDELNQILQLLEEKGSYWSSGRRATEPQFLERALTSYPITIFYQPAHGTLTYDPSAHTFYKSVIECADLISKKEVYGNGSCIAVCLRRMMKRLISKTHCIEIKTREELRQFLEIAEQHGLKWCDGRDAMEGVGIHFASDTKPITIFYNYLHLPGLCFDVEGRGLGKHMLSLEDLNCEVDVLKPMDLSVLGL